MWKIGGRALLNPFAQSGDFAEKRVSPEASGAVFWSLSCYKELKLTIKPFSRPSATDAKYELAKFGHAQKEVLTFLFASSPPLFVSLFLYFFFSWELSKLHYGGTNFLESF